MELIIEKQMVRKVVKYLKYLNLLSKITVKGITEKIIPLQIQVQENIIQKTILLL